LRPEEIVLNTAVHATVFNCRCRHCGYQIAYTSENVGADANCPNCGQTVRLPGKLETVAAIRRARRTDRAGLAMEIGGFAAMFFYFPFGMIAGATLVFFGWRKTNALVCSNCNTVLPSRKLPKCPGCKSKFGSD
jgi:Zn finger protein HypA/HybF involved in hydrogenase expression